MSQPVGTGFQDAAQDDLAAPSQAALRMRQYFPGLVDGGPPGLTSEEIGEYLRTAPKVRVQGAPSASRGDLFELFRDIQNVEAHGALIETLDVGGFRAVYSWHDTMQSLLVDRGESFLTVLAPADLDRTEILRVAASVPLSHAP